MSKRVKAPLKWHGGKYYLAPQIVSMMPEHVHYVEPFAGGLQVLFAKPFDNVSECVNDLHGELSNFWRVLADRDWFADFVRRVQAVPFSQPEFAEAYEALVSGRTLTQVECAVAFFICYRQSRQGIGRDFATLSRNRTRRGCNEQAAAWLGAVEGLADAHNRLKRVVVLNQDAVKVIGSQDGEKTFFYLDPPYVKETRTAPDVYSYEMTLEQHAQLLQALSKVRGKFILSGYRCALYDDAAEQHGWHRTDIEIDNKASGKKEKAKKTESLWCNYDKKA